jgi:hypothetical protein
VHASHFRHASEACRRFICISIIANFLWCVTSALPCTPMLYSILHAAALDLSCSKVLESEAQNAPGLWVLACFGYLHIAFWSGRGSAIPRCTHESVRGALLECVALACQLPAHGIHGYWQGCFWVGVGGVKSCIQSVHVNGMMTSLIIVARW